MSIRNLDAMKALSAGSEVWFISELASSFWSRKIDWYLNFQLASAQMHQTVAISPELRFIANKWQFDPPTFTVPEMSPLMVASERLLPNARTVVVPYRRSTRSKDSAVGASSAAAVAGDDGVANWIQNCAKLWGQMKQPTARIFLPDGLREGLKPEWIEKHFVADPKADGFKLGLSIEVVQGTTGSFFDRA